MVLSREEVEAVLPQLDGEPYLIGMLLYGSGLRVLEGLRLRVKDLDFARGETIVRDGKGRKDRVTMLPGTLCEPLQDHLRRVRVRVAEVHWFEAHGIGRQKMRIKRLLD